MNCVPLGAHLTASAPHRSPHVPTDPQAPEASHPDCDAEGIDVARAACAAKQPAFERTCGRRSAADTFDRCCTAQSRDGLASAQTLNGHCSAQTRDGRSSAQTIDGSAAAQALDGGAAAQTFDGAGDANAAAARRAAFGCAREPRRSAPFETHERAGPVLAA
jgi:hypothetical protein